MLFHLLQSVRPKQWIKNLFLFAPLVFSRGLFDPEPTLFALAGFATFCVLSGSVYLLNDLFDIEKDRQHPEKKNRPLASGALSAGAGVFALVTMLALATLCAFAIDPLFGVFALLYFVNNLAYSMYLKHVVIVDVMSIAIGFALRVLAGAAAIHVVATPWLLMCTILLALFLGFAKRRRELVLLDDKAEDHRKVLLHYSPYFLDQMIMIVTASTVMSYALYTMDPQTVGHFGTHNLIYTVPFVLYGIFRYLYLIHQRERGGDPTKVLLTDRPLLVTVALWLLACVGIVEGMI